MPAEGYPVSAGQCEWYYRRSGSVVRSPYMLNSGWLEPDIKQYLVPNYLAQAAKDLGVTDDRVRLGPGPVVRIKPGEALQEATSPRRFLEDIGAALAADPERRRSFAAELTQTVLNDSAVRRNWQEAARPAAGAAYDDLESLVVDGHRYHPSYKSRLGFDAHGSTPSNRMESDVT